MGAEIQRRTAAQLTGRSRTNPISLRRDPESLDQRGETSWSVVVVVVVVVVAAAAAAAAVFQRVLKMFCSVYYINTGAHHPIK